MWHIQTNLPYLQHEIHRTDWQTFQNQIPGTPTGFEIWEFAQHLLDNRHAIGPLNSIMETVYITNKGNMMDTIGRYYIFREMKNNNQN